MNDAECGMRNAETPKMRKGAACYAPIIPKIRKPEIITYL